MRDLKNGDLWKSLDEGHRNNVLNIVKYAFNEVDIMHQWAVEWNKVMKKLVRGLDKYKLFGAVETMQNSEDPKVSRMAKSNKWIKNHHFRAFTEEFIKFGDAAGDKLEEVNDAVPCSEGHHMVLCLSTENHIWSKVEIKNGQTLPPSQLTCYTPTCPPAS